MNKLMEKINDKFKGAESILIASFTMSVVSFIVFPLAIVIFANSIISSNNLLIKVLSIMAIVFCVLIIREAIVDGAETIKRTLRDCRNNVDVAMHKLNADSLKEFEKKEKEHIPNIEEQ